MCAALQRQAGVFGAMHPNDVDRRRIERALERRQRYRYVTPEICDAPNGYWIKSPCCSRNIDPEGGTIDVAMLEYLEHRSIWRIYRKDHRSRQWLLYDTYNRLADLLEQLNADPERVFWQ